jgi:hypothetical protein
MREFRDMLLSRFGIDMSGDPLVSGESADFGEPGGQFGDSGVPRHRFAEPAPNTTEANSGPPPTVDPSPPGAIRAPPGMT